MRRRYHDEDHQSLSREVSTISNSCFRVRQPLNVKITMHSKVIGDDRIVDGKIRYEFLIQSNND